MRTIILSFIISVVMAACNTVGCTDNRSSIPLVEFYSSLTDKAIGIDSIAIGGVGAPDDSLIVKPTRGTSQAYLPFRSQYNSVSYFISYRWKGMTDAFNDTVTFDYESIPYFASEECGAMFRYHVSRVVYTTHMLDSVVMLNDLITNVNIPSIRIYYPAQTVEE